MPLAARIQLKSCATGALAVFCKDTVIKQLAWNAADVVTRIDTVLLFTGAKAYRHGNGWWTVSGYASDASDVHMVADRVQHLIDDHRAPSETAAS
jgi:hypothetical protein